MNVSYLYTVLNVNEESRTMEVKYDSAEFGSINIFTRIPYEGENLEDVIRMYSPINFWLEKTKTVQTIDPSTTYGTIVWTNEKNLDERSAEARMLRNQLLLLSDYTQLSDAPSSINKEAWAAYRQELRDITLQEGFPDSIVWPQLPS